MNKSNCGPSDKTRRPSSRGRLPDGSANPVDIHVGMRIRKRRTLLGITQEALARELGITFQQVQKYERGMNRMGSSRLWDMAQVLGVSVSFFFEDMPPEIAEQSPRCFCLPEGRFCISETTLPPQEDPMSRTEIIELVKDYYRIHNRNLAEHLKNSIHAAAQPLYEKKADDDAENLLIAF